MKRNLLFLLFCIFLAGSAQAADVKISELPELTTPTTADMYPTVNNGVTKRITWANIVTGMKSSLGITGITDSISTTSSSVAASATAVKAAYDLANSKQSLLNNPVTGPDTPTAGMLTKWNTSGTSLVDGLKIGTLTDTKFCTYTAANGLVCNTNTPSSMVYPGAGVPNSTGSAWGTSYTVGTEASNLVQLNGSSQLPAVSAALLTNFPTLNQNTSGTAANLSGTPTLPNGTSATTQSQGNNSTNLATTAYVDTGLSLKLSQSSGLASALPGTCSYPAVYFATDTKDYYFCTASNEWYKAFGKGSDGNFKITLLNNTAASPTDSTDELYFEANILKANQNGTESSVVLGPTGSQIVMTGTPLYAAVPGTIDGSAGVTLTAAQMSDPRCHVSNYGQAASDVANNLPPAADNLSCLFDVGTAQTNKWGVRADTNDKIYLIASDGSITSGSDNGYASMTNAQVGQSFACWSFRTGSSSYDWKCQAIAIGTSTFAAN